MTAHNRLGVIVALGTTQTLGCASSFYLSAILGDRITEDLGMSSTRFAAFSASLVFSALVGPRTDRTMDAVGGREELADSNMMLAAGLAGTPSPTRAEIGD
jgi:hypothetical protein